MKYHDSQSVVRIKTAADLLGVTTQTVRNWVSAGRLKAARHPINGYRLFRRQDIERLMTPGYVPGESGAVGRDAMSKAPTSSTGINSTRPRLREDAELNYQAVCTDFSDEVELAAQRDREWLLRSSAPNSGGSSKQLVIGDAFCGGGIFSLGAERGLRSAGFCVSHSFGIDFDQDSINTFRHNFPKSKCEHADITSIIDGKIGEKSTASERSFLSRVSNRLDVLLGGPPCQGHSDLNNHTRRSDPKNELYLSMVRLAELLNPRVIIIENVPGVVHDKGGVVHAANNWLERLGYAVSSKLFDLSKIGVPQRRRRFVLVASKKVRVDLEAIDQANSVPPRAVSWAIEDLLDKYDELSVYNSSSTHSAENQRRIRYLFAHDLYELPNSQRPPCHRNGNHSYHSVYGRMHWDAPAPTITGGFGSTGQGRFVHPRLPRTLTPHEACRLQFIPDFFIFPDSVKRRSMQQIIGNAAPPKLSEIVLSGIAKQGVLQ